MNPWQRRWLWGSSVLVAATGFVYAALRYLVRPADPFSAYNHPLQPWALAAHVLLAPALLFAVGWFWGNHVLPKLARRAPGRGSGLALLALVAAMTVSGYVLQVSSDAGLRLALAWTHGVLGTAYVGWLVGHAIAAPRADRRVRGEVAPEAGSPHFGSPPSPAVVASPVPRRPGAGTGSAIEEVASVRPRSGRHGGTRG